MTIKDVAAAASVSLTTVSDVVNGKGRVDPETRTRVMAAVARLGYRPQRAARALRSGRTGIIGLCTELILDNDAPLSWMNSDYDLRLAQACASAALRADQLLLLAPKPTSLADISRMDVDGVIMVDPPLADESLTLLEQANVPFVTVDRDPSRANGWWVGADNAETTHKVMDHFAASRPVNRPLLLTVDLSYAWFEDAKTAFLRWCTAHNVEPTIRLLDDSAPRESAEHAVSELLHDGIPDAVLALPHYSSLGVLDAARRHGLDVPGDIRVVAGVDAQVLQTARPEISAIDLHPQQVGQAAVELLRRRISGSDTSGPIVVEPTLIVRATS